jgi:hypothetical protein
LQSSSEPVSPSSVPIFKRAESNIDEYVRVFEIARYSLTVKQW